MPATLSKNGSATRTEQEKIGDREGPGASDQAPRREGAEDHSSQGSYAIFFSSSPRLAARR